MKKKRFSPKRRSRGMRVKRGSSKCRFCSNPEIEIDYKDVVSLRRHISAQGKIIGRRKARLCAFHQRQITEAVKRARTVALLSPTVKLGKK